MDLSDNEHPEAIPAQEQNTILVTGGADGTANEGTERSVSGLRGSGGEHTRSSLHINLLYGDQFSRIVDMKSRFLGYGKEHESSSFVIQPFQHEQAEFNVRNDVLTERVLAHTRR